MKTLLATTAIMFIGSAAIAGNNQTFERPEPRPTFYQCWPYPATLSRSMHNQRVALGLCDGGYEWEGSDDPDRPEPKEPEPPVDPCSCKDRDLWENKKVW